MISIKIKSGKEKALKQHHPWVFSGALEHIKQQPADGDIVQLLENQDNFLAFGYYNSQSKISVRAIEWNKDAIIDDQWWKNKIRKAIERRANLLKNTNTDSFRLIYSEADGLSGLIVDKYADFLVIQSLNPGIDKRKELITNILFDLLSPKGIYERSDAKARSQEGLKSSNGVLKGECPPEYLEIKENGLNFIVNIIDGQKSGYFLDQRDTRKYVGEQCKDLNVIDCFCYAGGFSLNAIKNGAKSVISIDSSALAIEMVKRNYEANNIQYQPENLIQGDVNDTLRRFQKENRQCDLIILDPPKLAPNRSAVDKALRAYKDLNLQALRLLSSGGMLATFSCSGGVDLSMLKQVISWAALDAGKEVQFINQFIQPEDHPILASFPESEYLKGLFCKVL